ncbi:kinase-like protein [Meredithblackwellia eburnea MCA 4105]
MKTSLKERRLQLALENVEPNSDPDTTNITTTRTRRLQKRSQLVTPIITRRHNETGRLITVDPQRGRLQLVIQLEKKFRIGRSSSANDYAINKPDVSQKHAILYALTSDTNHTITIYEDCSTNGSLYNDRLLHRATAVLFDGDRIEIAGRVFVWRNSTINFDTLEDTQGRTIRQERRRRLGDYLVFEKSLGSGSFSTVHVAFNLNSLKQVACKVIKTSTSRQGDIHIPWTQHDLDRTRREVNILKNLNHPNINSVENVYWDENEMITGGDLFTYLTSQPLNRLEPPEVKWIMWQLFRALFYLHEEGGVSHRDLKLENIIVSGSGPFPRVLVADFGAARFVKNSSTRFNSITGTLIYLAPEALLAVSRHQGYDGKPLDMWALGIVMTMLLTGSHPFESHYFPSSHCDDGSCNVKSLLGSAFSLFDDKHEPGRDERTCRNVVTGNAVNLPEKGLMRFGSGDNAGE